MSIFFTLPPEIRHKIYEECLVVGKTFPYRFRDCYDDYDYDYKDDSTASKLACDRVPEIALLLVCKAIVAEAEPLLYQRNIFVLPAADLTARFFKYSLYNDTRRAWVKSVEMGFEALDLTRDEGKIPLDEDLKLTPDDMLFRSDSGLGVGPQRSVNAWAQDLHEAYKVCLSSLVWPLKASLVLDHLQLRELVIDFRDARCSEGCCCMKKDAIDAISVGFAMGVPKTLRLIGLGEARETAKDIIRLSTLMRRSRPRSNTEVQWKGAMISLGEVTECELDGGTFGPR
jgi:hypothetical protein